MNLRSKLIIAGIATLLTGSFSFAQDDAPLAPAFGEPTEISMPSQPEWQNESNTAVARWTLNHADASAWKLTFRSLALPEGAQMYLRGIDAATGAVRSIHGPYEGNGPLNIPMFSTALIEGNSVTIEIRSTARLSEWPFQLQSAERIGAARLAELQAKGVKLQQRVTPGIRRVNAAPDVRSAWVGDRLMMFELVDGEAVAEGDIILADVPGTKSDRKYSNIRNETAGLWPNGRIPYVLAGTTSGANYEEIDPSVKWAVDNAVAYWNGIYPGMLKPRANEADYVVVRVQQGTCSSSVGRVGGAQYINLDPNCSTESIVHEFAHAAGLWHEQQRPDRDQYVKINWDNIATGKKHNFEIPASAKAEGAYDFGSLMHYSSHAFSSNGKPTIQPLTSGITLGGSQLSAGDRGGISKLYCSGALASGPATIFTDGLADAYSFNITMPSYCSWSLSVSGTWIKVTSATSGKGSTTVQFSVTTNTGQAMRTGSIKYAGKTTWVKQEPLNTLN